MIEAAFIFAFAYVIGAFIQKSYHMKPRKAFCQVTVNGVTDQDGESFILTGTLFDDETPGKWYEKVDAMCAIRQRRLKIINEYMQKIQADAKLAWEGEQLAKAEGKVSPLKSKA